MKFDANGKLFQDQKIEIYFEMMAQNILALEIAARKRNLFVKKVLLKINLFKTKSGQLLKERNIFSQLLIACMMIITKLIFASSKINRH